MKIFIDSANIEEIKKYMSWGVCDGVTTNPSICLKCGVNGGKEGYKQRALEIASLIYPLPLSVEVTTENDKEIIDQAREYSKWAENITVKITVTDSKGNSFLPVIRQLIEEGVAINVTAIMTFNQAILAAKAINAGLKNASVKRLNFVSIFSGRIADEQGVEKAFQVVKNVRDWLDTYQFKDIEIIIASVRNPENIELWAKAGGHIMTIPPEIILKSLLSAKTKEAVTQFINDAKNI